MKILIVTALPAELKAIKSGFREQKIPWISVDFFVTWMWNYRTILHLTEFLSHRNYDFILNIGSAGFLRLSDPRDLFQVWQILNLANKKEKIPPISIQFSDLANIFCSDFPVKSRQELPKEIFWKNILVDMESYAFEMVCDFFKVPRAILKLPVDKIWEKFDSDIFRSKAKLLDFEDILKKISKFLSKVPKREDLSNYFDYFRFSSSQERIFTEVYNKWKAIREDDFDSFFEENKNLDRKQFLRKLSDELNQDIEP